MTVYSENDKAANIENHVLEEQGPLGSIKLRKWTRVTVISVSAFPLFITGGQDWSQDLAT